MSHHDVVVIGTGLAGLTAAVRLAESGARVLVLAKGVGATHLAPGTASPRACLSSSGSLRSPGRCSTSSSPWKIQSSSRAWRSWSP